MWALEVRAPFLILPVILSALGSALGSYQGFLFDFKHFLAFTAVLVLLHVTVNTLNEYYDHMLGIDYHTQRTMYNGGSGVLQQGILQPEEAFKAAMLCFALATLLGIYLLISVGIILLPIIVLGMLFSLFYTQVFARNMLGELSAGLGLGFLPVLGAFMVQSHTINASILVLALMSGILTFNLLLLNQFPDQQADRQGGRRNLVLYLGQERSAILYSSLTFSVYGVILAAVLVGLFPWPVLLGFLTLPLAYRASIAAFEYGSRPGFFVEGQGANVKMILFTQILAVAGLIVAILQTRLF